jgi:cytochrome b subunit of formate dehydrogenase
MKLLWLSVLFLAAAAAAQNSGGPGTPASTATGPDNQACAACHQEVADKIKGHVHGGVACQSCHVKHEEYPHPEGIAKPDCAACHSAIAKDYSHGVHALAARKGNLMAPDCATCHGKAHELEAARTVQFRAAVPDLCGSCHSEVAEQYQDSVHGQAVKRGLIQAPVCTDCHGEHSILAPTNASSSVHPSHVRDTCAGCHDDVRLTRRFGLPADRIVSFDASFHGLAAKSGAETVANCSSCHGVHNIRASSDPKSTIHPANLAKTCGQCHAGAGQRFALGRIHVVPGNGEPLPLKWVRYIYVLIIPLTIGFMFLHNFGDWLRKLKRLRFSPRAEDGLPAHEPELRTLWFERIEHGVLAVSFIVLAWTGFALKYPDHWWARPLLLWESARSTRGIIHRTASVVFMASALAHLLSLMFSRTLREHWRKLWPLKRDFSEALSNFLYNTGLRKQLPLRSPHSYVEKMEYWALVWGSVVMAATGVLLWADRIALKWLPKIVLDVATSIHFYEAILATLAIAVWHFYFVMFDPNVYPMDSAWLTGRSPRKETNLQQVEELVGELEPEKK